MEHKSKEEKLLDFLAEHKAAAQNYTKVVGCGLMSKSRKPIGILSLSPFSYAWIVKGEEPRVKVQVSRIGYHTRKFQTVLIAEAAHQLVKFRERTTEVGLYSDMQKEPVDTVQQPDPEYPYELYVVYDEIEYFELLTQQEWDQEAKRLFAEDGKHNPLRPCCENCAEPLSQRMSTYCGKCRCDDFCMFKPKEVNDG